MAIILGIVINLVRLFPCSSSSFLFPREQSLTSSLAYRSSVSFAFSARPLVSRSFRRTICSTFDHMFSYSLATRYFFSLAFGKGDDETEREKRCAMNASGLRRERREC